eukprot:13045227-Heterocapsa_arctica.AAC.1
MPRGSRPKRAVASPAAPRRRVRTLVGTAALVVVVDAVLVAVARRNTPDSSWARTSYRETQRSPDGDRCSRCSRRVVLFRRRDVDSSRRRCRRSRRLEGPPRWPRRRCCPIPRRPGQRPACPNA